MRLLAAFTALITAALPLQAPLFAQPAGDPALEAKLAEFDAFVREYRTQNTVLSMSYAVVVDGEIVAAHGIGWQDHDAEERTTADTSYLVASITKTFTGATLIGMDADGIIDLDAPFTDLSDWDGRCEWLSGAGLPMSGGVTLDDGYTPPPIDCNATLSLRNVLQMRVLGEPGSNFLYNPIVFGRLANWVEEQTGEPFDVWVRRYVIDKAGLANIAAGWRDPHGGDALRLLAPPFRHAPEEGDNLAPSPLPNPEMNASSGIIAGARARLPNIRSRSTKAASCRLRFAIRCGPRRPRPTARLRAMPMAGGRKAGTASGWCGTVAGGPMPMRACCSSCRTKG